MQVISTLSTFIIGFPSLPNGVHLSTKLSSVSPISSKSFGIHHYLFKRLHSRRRKFGLVNFVSLLPDFSYYLWRLCQSESTLSWGSKASKACCFSTTFALMDEVKDKAALSDNCTIYP